MIITAYISVVAKKDFIKSLLSSTSSIYFLYLNSFTSSGGLNIPLSVGSHFFSLTSFSLSLDDTSVGNSKNTSLIFFQLPSISISPSGFSSPLLTMDISMSFV
ncbi:MAG: hypothetical protein DRH49_02025 [Candidatus Coatesbacteria bacterium]|nr:MAG: hypothetical protein DRH49_02025 [Candidatus Coatesbacteria bacterium]